VSAKIATAASWLGSCFGGQVAAVFGPAFTGCSR